MKFAIWTGNVWEDWGPQSPYTTGLGGSETAAVEMGKSLTRRGHQVQIYGRFTDEDEGVHDGVTYTRFDRVLDPGEIACDVFISSRNKDALSLKPDARMTALWVHDIHCGDDFQWKLPKFDRILCLSQWHAKHFLSYYPHLKREKIAVTRNGLALNRFYPKENWAEVQKMKSDGMRFTYSSSPDRGLDLLLTMWPTIRQMSSGAELHIYYGFNTWEKMAEKSPETLARIAWLKERIRKNEDKGVVFHGRANQTEVAESQMKSSMWLYPTDFKETSCITAMEAQAAGAVPVCTSLAALSETVKHGMLIKPYAGELRYEHDFLLSTKHGFDRPDELAIVGELGRRYALENLSWDGVAAQWEQIFGEV